MAAIYTQGITDYNFDIKLIRDVVLKPRFKSDKAISQEMKKLKSLMVVMLEEMEMNPKGIKIIDTIEYINTQLSI